MFFKTFIRKKGVYGIGSINNWRQYEIDCEYAIVAVTLS